MRRRVAEVAIAAFCVLSLGCGRQESEPVVPPDSTTNTTPDVVHEVSIPSETVPSLDAQETLEKPAVDLQEEASSELALVSTGKVDVTKQDQPFVPPAGKQTGIVTKRSDAPAAPKTERKPYWEGWPPARCMETYLEMKPKEQAAKVKLDTVLEASLAASAEAQTWQKEVDQRNALLAEALVDAPALADFEEMLAAKKSEFDQVTTLLRQLSADRSAGQEIDVESYNESLKTRNELMQTVRNAKSVRSRIEDQIIAGDPALANLPSEIVRLESKIKNKISNTPQVSAARREYNKIRDDRLDLGQYVHSESFQRDYQQLTK